MIRNSLRSVDDCARLEPVRNPALRPPPYGEPKIPLHVLAAAAAFNTFIPPGNGVKRAARVRAKRGSRLACQKVVGLPVTE